MQKATKQSRKLLFSSSESDVRQNLGKVEHGTGVIISVQRVKCISQERDLWIAAKAEKKVSTTNIFQFGKANRSNI